MEMEWAPIQFSTPPQPLLPMTWDLSRDNPCINKRDHRYTLSSHMMLCYSHCYAPRFLFRTEQYIIYQEHSFGASLVAQWWGFRLPMQGTRVRALVREDPTCCGATKPMRHNYWACALEPVSHNYWAHMPQLLKPVCLGPVLHNKRSHHNEKPMYRNEE